MQQKKTILKEGKDFFLAVRTIRYETGFEHGIDLFGSRYEVWDKKYKDKYEEDRIEEYQDGKVVHYCRLYTAANDEEMIKIFDAQFENGR